MRIFFVFVLMQTFDHKLNSDSHNARYDFFYFYFLVTKFDLDFDLFGKSCRGSGGVDWRSGKEGKELLWGWNDSVWGREAKGSSQISEEEDEEEGYNEWQW